MAERIAGKARVELGVKDRLKRGLNRAGGQLRAFSANVAKVGRRMVVVGAAFLAPIVGGLKSFASTGDALDKMSKRTAVAASRLSAMSFAAAQSGATLDDLEKAMKGSARFAFDLKHGMSTAKDVAEELGITYDDLKGKSPDEVFKLLASKIRDVKNPTEQMALAMKAFGKSGAQLLPLIKSDMEALVAEAHKLGIVLSDEDARAAAEFTDAMNRTRQQTKMVFMQIGAALVPALNELSTTLQPIIKRVIEWVKENRPLVMLIAKFAAITVGAGFAMLALSGLFKLAAMAVGVFAFAVKAAGALLLVFKGIVAGVTLVVGIIKGALMLVLSPFALITAAIGGAVFAFFKFTQSGKQAGQGIKNALGSLGGIAKTTFGGIADALKAGDFQLAAKIGLTGVKLAFQTIVNQIKKIWFGLVDTLAFAWGALVANVKKMWVTVIKGLPLNILMDKTKEQRQRLDAMSEKAFDKAVRLRQQGADAATIKEAEDDYRRIREAHDALLQPMKNLAGDITASNKEFRKTMDELSRRRTRPDESELQKLRDELARLRAQARDQAAGPVDGGAFGVGAMGIQAAVNAAKAAAKLDERGVDKALDQAAERSVRGTFSVTQAVQFRGAQTALSEKQLAALKQVEEHTGDIAADIADIADKDGLVLGV